MSQHFFKIIVGLVLAGSLYAFWDTFSLMKLGFAEGFVAGATVAWWVFALVVSLRDLKRMREKRNPGDLEYLHRKEDR